MDGEGLGGTLRTLRESRRLSLADAARRAGVSKAALQHWERDRFRPSGARLARTLDALGADPRLRARLIAEADVQFARIELAHTPLGAPVDVGMVLRAMRGRRGLTQAELAQAAGVTQSAVAKWESGDSTPSPQTIHALGFALGATVEETVALASAQNAGPGGVPQAFGIVQWAIPDHSWHASIPYVLYDVVSLGWEAELWRRALRDPLWERSLCRLLAYRADHLVFEGRMEEVETVARRALRLATSPEALPDAVPAISALVALAQRRGARPSRLERVGASWAERLPDSPMRGWALKIQATSLAAMGRIAEGEDAMERSIEVTENTVSWESARTDREACLLRASSLCDYHLASGEPERALSLIEDRLPRYFDPHVYVRVMHENGRALDPSDADTVLGIYLSPLYDGPRRRRDLRRFVWNQARLLARV